MTRLAARDARDHVADVLNRVAFGRERVILKRRGKDLAALAEGKQEGFIPWEDSKKDLNL